MRDWLNGFSEQHLGTLTNVLALLVAALAIFTGFSLARGNVDIPCWNVSTTREEGGSCTGGSWTTWSTTAEDGTTVTERRVYTGVLNTVSAVITYNTCGGISNNSAANITSQSSACQIEETRTRSGTGSGGSGGSGSGSGFEILSYNTQQTVGDIISTMNVQGTVSDFNDFVEARLATSSIRAIPMLVRSGETTRIVWDSEYVRLCRVTGTNGDSWPLPVGGQLPVALSGDETSAPIVQQTTYTLACTTALGNIIGGDVIVNIIPTFNEQ